MPKQLEILKEQGISTVYQDVISREATGQKQFYILIDKLLENDIVIITKLSRIADSLTELSELCSLFSSKGVVFKVLELGPITLKSNNISSENWLQALRKFEQDIKYEKICKGHLISRKNHQSDSTIPSGSPPKYSKKQLGEALKLRGRYT